MLLPSQLSIRSFRYFLDGGTTVLCAVDEGGREHTVTLSQHVFPQTDACNGFLPGRLYFDGSLVEFRSLKEARILDLLRVAQVLPYPRQAEPAEEARLSSEAIILSSDIQQVLSRNLTDNLRALLESIVEFVESDSYLQFAVRVMGAADTTAYSMWVEWEPAERNQVLVRLARLLGTGLQGARDFLDRGEPVAAKVTGLEAAEVVRR
jgi:hypothetical protein